MGAKEVFSKAVEDDLDFGAPLRRMRDIDERLDDDSEVGMV
jgi:hypothetical protein